MPRDTVRRNRHMKLFNRQREDMMRRIVSVALVLLLFSLTTRGAYSQQNTPSLNTPRVVSELERMLVARPVVNQKLTLQQAVDIALKESPIMRGAAEDVEAAIGR